MGRGSVSLRGLLQAAALLTLVLSLAMSVNVEHAWWQLFTHFRLQYFAASILLAAALLLMRSQRFAALMIAAAFVNGWYVVPWYLGGPSAADGPLLRVMQFNVLAQNEDYDRLLRLVERELPDVIVLQEVTAAWQRALGALNSAYPHRLILAREDNFGIALLSRVPLNSITHVASPPSGYPSIVANIDVEGTAVSLIGTHPTTPVTSSNYVSRNIQLQSVTALASAASGPVVIVGDLNATLWDRRYAEVEAAASLRNARQGFGIKPTWPTFLPIAMIPIDHILVSRHFGVSALRTGPSIGSDHLPLFATLVIRPGPTPTRGPG